LAHEFHILGGRTKTHDFLYTGSIIPRTIEENDFTAGRQLFNVTLKIPLSDFFHIRFF